MIACTSSLESPAISAARPAIWGHTELKSLLKSKDNAKTGLCLYAIASTMYVILEMGYIVSKNRKRPKRNRNRKISLRSQSAKCNIASLAAEIAEKSPERSPEIVLGRGKQWQRLRNFKTAAFSGRKLPKTEKRVGTFGYSPAPKPSRAPC